MIRDTTLLTGIPRSGTTLVCALLNEFENTLALAEPIALHAHGDRLRAVTEIEEFINDARSQTLRYGEVISKHVNGVIPDNWVEAPSVSGQLRKVLEDRGAIRVGRSLDENFHLVVKHPAEFSALADLLLERYRVIALVRHPLAVLASWQTIDMPVHYGHMPMAEAFSPVLANVLAAEPDRIKRQVKLIGWLLGVYSNFPADCVIRYEDLIAAPRHVLSRFFPNARDPSRELTAQAPEKRYAHVDFSELAKELVTIEKAAERFYPDFTASLSPWGMG